MTNQNKPNHWESYGVYAMATYMQNKLASNVVLDLDTAWEESIRLYNEFTNSRYNVEGKSELDCINEFMNSKAITLTDSEQALLDELNNFVEYAYSDDNDRERMRGCAYDYVTEVLRDEREGLVHLESTDYTYVLFGSDLVRIAEDNDLDAQKIADAINQIGGINSIQVFSNLDKPSSIIECTIGWGDYLVLSESKYLEIKNLLNN